MSASGTLREKYAARPGEYFGLRAMGRTPAKTLGYVAVTSELDLETEGELAESMARGMAGVDAIWIEHGPDAGRRLVLARKRTELAQVEEPEEEG